MLVTLQTPFFFFFLTHFSSSAMLIKKKKKSKPSVPFLNQFVSMGNLEQLKLTLLSAAFESVKSHFSSSEQRVGLKKSP